MRNAIAAIVIAASILLVVTACAEKPRPTLPPLEVYAQWILQDPAGLEICETTSLHLVVVRGYGMPFSVAADIGARNLDKHPDDIAHAWRACLTAMHRKYPELVTNDVLIWAGLPPRGEYS